MKQILNLVIPIFFLIGGSWFWYQNNYGTTDYYTKITTDGNRTNIGSGGGRDAHFRYEYKLKAYNENGDSKNIEFHSMSDRPLKKQAYLVTHVNNKKGVMGWEEVKSADIPSNALKPLAH
ncbi:YxeA family protein [Enterococcus sp. AZ007]|uniref:YxeA family protein n=1 Tax=Enterococcus sp. AZ007 TaxID=2774839 RepID=UPI003F243FA0